MYAPKHTNAPYVCHHAQYFFSPQRRAPGADSSLSFPTSTAEANPQEQEYIAYIHKHIAVSQVSTRTQPCGSRVQGKVKTKPTWCGCYFEPDRPRANSGTGRQQIDGTHNKTSSGHGGEMGVGGGGGDITMRDCVVARLGAAALEHYCRNVTCYEVNVNSNDEISRAPVSAEVQPHHTCTANIFDVRALLICKGPTP